MKLKDDVNLRSLIEKEILEHFENQRSQLRDDARLNLLKIQEENRKTYNCKRKKARQYEAGDIVAIRRTQLGGGLKLYPKFLGPFKVVSHSFKKIGDMGFLEVYPPPLPNLFFHPFQFFPYVFPLFL